MTTISFRSQKEREQKFKAPVKHVFVSSASQEVIAYLTPRIRNLIAKLPGEALAELEEIRMRQGRVLLFQLGGKEAALTRAGKLTSRWLEGVEITHEDLHKTLQIVSQNSLYALEEELRNGFLTLPGGHRVGLVGQTVLEKGEIKTLKEISGLNFRIGRQVLGAADPIMPYLINRKKHSVYHTLLISPPRAGKTTLLRDIIRQLSNGIPALGFSGVNVGLVDERSEIAGCYAGIAQKEIGFRTDVLDRCPKAKGMSMLLRSMAPQVVATDEIGRQEDVDAIADLLNAGVSVITTAHGVSLQDLRQRPVLRTLLTQKIFERFVFLSCTRGPGTIEAVLDAGTEQPLFYPPVT